MLTEVSEILFCIQTDFLKVRFCYIEFTLSDTILEILESLRKNRLYKCNTVIMENKRIAVNTLNVSPVLLF